MIIPRQATKMSAAAAQQQYPSKAAKISVGMTAGGHTDS
jgi:tripartite-type tricarboxylate transporter receptor subunit TctC